MSKTHSSAAAQKRQQQLYLVFGVIVVAVVAFVVILFTSQLTDTPGSAGASAADSVYASVVRGVSAEGMPQLGSPDAPVTIHEYSSFSCPHCANFHGSQFMELLNNEIRNGEVRFVFVPLSGQTSIGATLAAFCADEQGAFWEMHDAMFALLLRFMSTAAFSQENLVASARELELDEAAFTACLASDEALQRAQSANDLFYALAEQYPGEVTGTPTVAINSVPPEIVPGYRSGAAPIEFIREQIAAARG